MLRMLVNCTSAWEVLGCRLSSVIYTRRGIELLTNTTTRGVCERTTFNDLFILLVVRRKYKPAQVFHVGFRPHVLYGGSRHLLSAKLSNREFVEIIRAKSMLISPINV